MDKINISSEKVSSELAIFLFREDDNFVAYSPALDLSGYGKTEEDARNSFNIVLKEYFESAVSMMRGTADFSFFFLEASN